MNNPLSKYFRQPELYITLPSQGRWWSKDSLNMPPNNELPVASMNGTDEIAMKNAEGLMNGDTSVKVIQSCCSNIKNAWSMPSIDVDTIFIAIRIASYGHQMDMETSCSKCNETIEYAVDLRSVLSSIKIPDYETPLFINDLTIYLKPASYQVVNLNSQEVYQQQRALLAVQNDNISNEDKTRIIREAVIRLSTITVNKIYEYIDRIITPDGITVSDSTFIREFITNADRETFDQLKAGIQEKNDQYILPKVDVKCDHCGSIEPRALQFDPSNFFARGS